MTQNLKIQFSKNPQNERESTLVFPHIIDKPLQSTDIAALDAALEKIQFLLLLDFAQDVETTLQKYDYIYMGGVNEYNDEGYDNSFYMYGFTAKEHGILQGEIDDDEEDADSIREKAEYLNFGHAQISDTLLSQFSCDAEYSSDLAAFNFFSKNDLPQFYTQLLGEQAYAQYKVMIDKYKLEDSTPTATKTTSESAYVLKI